MRQIPTTSVESDAFSKDLKRRGFSFVGSTVVDAYMLCWLSTELGLKSRMDWAATKAELILNS